MKRCRPVGAGKARTGGIRRTGAYGKAEGRTCPAPTYTTIHAALLLQNKPPPRCGACGPHRGGGCGIQTALKKIVAVEIVDA